MSRSDSPHTRCVSHNPFRIPFQSVREIPRRRTQPTCLCPAADTLGVSREPHKIGFAPCFHYCRTSAIIGVLPVVRLLMPLHRHPSPAPLRKASQPTTTSAALALPALLSGLPISLLIIAASATGDGACDGAGMEGFANCERSFRYRNMDNAAFRLQY